MMFKNTICTLAVAAWLVIGSASVASQGLKPTAATEEQKAEFTGEVELSGRLTWSDGSPAAKETFDLLAYGGRYQHLKIREVRTDADGRYRAQGLKGQGARYRLWLTSDSNQRTFYIFMPRDRTNVQYDYQYQPRLGDPAPEHVMPDLEGNPVDLADLKGKIVVLKFWAVWCGPCHSEMRKIAALIRTKDSWKDNVTVVAVNADPRKRTVTDFIEKNGLHGMIHLFEQGKKWESIRGRAFKVNSVPFTFVLDRRGIVRFRDDISDEMEATIDALLAEEGHEG